MTEITEHQLSHGLSTIELRELRLLKWGVLDSVMTRDEVVSAVAKSFENPVPIVDRLCELGLIVKVPSGGYRSRMSETIRMLARLRNLKRSEATWEGMPLVNDYRIEHRPRSRPKRDLPGAQLADTAPEDALPQVSESLRTLAPEWVSGFQKRSTQEVLRRLQLDSPAGVMIASGTGSGKTNAFYLPALSWLVGELAEQSTAGVRILAIYPRGELLKDQLANTLKLTLQLREAGVGVRPVRIGAWFGPTPKWSQYLPRGWAAGWKRKKKNGADFSWSCPYLGCPNCDAQSLEWLKTDVDAEVERLVCDKCGFELESDLVALTRKGMKERPVDILFTTTESLNRQLADPEFHSAFGLAGDQRTRIVLLDEVHTYEGISGAQNAYLMRRLKSAISRPVLWAGLSATLENPEAFFAGLVGLFKHQVTVVRPENSELIESGAEYLIALQHDAAYPTGHLATTIQTTMALTRCLDSKPQLFGGQSIDSTGFFGTKSFVFTDKLDVTNRLSDYLNDAEGWARQGIPQQRRVLTLAHLRSKLQSKRPVGDQEDNVEREPQGQWWWLSEKLGHDLEADSQLIVGRTTSQDVGVNRDADVVVATASLEVGYDDDGVGAVIQHSAPHDSARFLQRKGRAGRDPQMRPWTAVVLSAGGRDRVAWQTYDQLFNPRLDPSRLPMANRHVQRMQATYATLDWLARRLAPLGPFNLSSWVDLTGPADVVHPNSPNSASFLRRRQDEAARVLREVLNGGAARADLTSYLKRVLGFDQLFREEGDQAVAALLWEPPRSLLLAVLPTALRRLESQWAGEEPSQDSIKTRQPLKEFIVGNLFEDLLTPEVEVRLPSGGQGLEIRSEPMPQIRSLREFMPGNVTRHFGGDKDAFGRRHWVSLPEDQQAVNVEDVYKATYLGEVPDREGLATPLYRPLEAPLVIPPGGVKDYSTVSPVWQAHLTALAEGRPVDLGASGWARLQLEVIVHSHGTGGGARIRRYAHSALGHLVEGRDVTPVELQFCNNDERRVALGVELDVDALCLRLQVPPADDPPDRLERSDRQLRLLEEAGLPSVLGPSRRSALLSALQLVLAELDGDRFESFESLSDRDLSIQLVGALARLGMSNLDEADVLSWEGDEEDEEDEDAVSFTDLGQWCSHPSVVAALRSAAECSWQQDRDEAWEAWRQQQLANTVGAIWVEAACRACPDIDSNDLTVDVDPRGVHEADGSIEVWVLENAPGGNGQIELLYSELLSEPIRFLRFLERVLQPSDIELLDREIREVLVSLVGDNEVRSLVRSLRTAWEDSHEAVRGAFESLKDELRVKGLDPRRIVWITLMSRVLAPGADKDLPSKVLELLEGWDALEKDLWLDVDPITFIATIPEDDSVKAVFRIPDDADLAHRNRTIGNFFWLRERRASQTYRSLPNLFGLPLGTDVASLRSLVIQEMNSFSADDLGPDQFREIQQELAEHGVVDVVVPATSADSVKRFLIQSQMDPVEFGALHLYPRVMGLSRTDGRITVTIALEEIAGMGLVVEFGP